MNGCPDTIRLLVRFGDVPLVCRLLDHGLDDGANTERRQKMTDKRTCTKAVEDKKPSLRWFDLWNPWALRRKIIEKNNIIIEKNEYCISLIDKLIANEERIEALKIELARKTKECALHGECAMFNSKEAVRMRAEINAAIGLLQDVVKEKAE